MGSGASGSGPGPLRTLHASCVARGGRAVLIRGASGRGKSGLALRLIALGAGLVSDDRTRIRRAGDALIADAPDSIRGRIEARGMGVLRLPATGPCEVAVVVDLDRRSAERLPPLERIEIEGLSLPLVCGSDAAHFPAAILLYLEHGELE